MTTPGRGSAASPDPRPPQRLSVIEGARGVAAVVVCLSHLIYLVAHMPPQSPGGELGPDWLRLLLRPFTYGNEMVSFFIVISGFSLFYAESVRRGRGRAPTALREFTRRRAWRILPTYYVALGLGLAITLLVRTTTFAHGEPVVTQLTAGGILSHMFLIHNLGPSWVFQINAPLWSIAYEAQLYLLFPLILWLAGRTNLAVALTVIVLPLSAIGHTHPATPVFGLIGWFGLGIACAYFCLNHAARSWPLAVVGCATLALAVVNPSPMHNAIGHDLVWGTSFATLIVAGFFGGVVERALSARSVRYLGKVSYSLYAMHYPLALALLVVSERAGLSGLSVLAVMLVVGLPLSIGSAAVSFRLVEAPSLARAHRRGSALRPGAVVQEAA
jgi:peptidoglycan/LPS O-acetylase OafA/YrhL